MDQSEILGMEVANFLLALGILGVTIFLMVTYIQNKERVTTLSAPAPAPAPAPAAPAAK